MRQIIVGGVIGTDAVLKTTQSGRPYVTYRLASNLPVRRQNNQLNGVDETVWFSIVDYEEVRVKGLLPYLKKGSHVYIVGEFRPRKYTNKHTNALELSLDIWVEHFEFLNSSNGNRPQNPQFQQPMMTGIAAPNGGYVMQQPMQQPMQQQMQYPQQQMQQPMQQVQYPQQQMQQGQQYPQQPMQPMQQPPVQATQPVMNEAPGINNQQQAPVQAQQPTMGMPAAQPMPQPVEPQPQSAAPEQAAYPVQQANIDGTTVDVIPTQPLSAIANDDTLPF